MNHYFKNIDKKKYNKFLTLLLSGIFILSIYLIIPKFARSFFYDSYETHIVINGKPYGVLEDQNIMSHITYDLSSKKESDYKKISLRREFVAEPSLYWWARKSFDNLERTDIELHLKNPRGDLLERYQLKYCKPLAWAIEEHDISSGGFSETVEIAVKSIHKL